MSWFWHALWICLVVIPVTVLWVVSVFDIVFRRSDLAAWKRLGALVLVLVLPVIGALIYVGLLARPAQGAEARGELEYRDLESLRANGALDDVEYERARGRAVRTWM